MTVLAHVAGVPVEEALPMLAGTSTVLVFARAWLSLHLGRR